MPGPLTRFAMETRSPMNENLTQPLPTKALAPATRQRVRERWVDTFTRWRYTWWPDHMLGELLAKRWMETAIPVIVLLLVAFSLSQAIPNFMSPQALSDPVARPAKSASLCWGWRW